MGTIYVDLASLETRTWNKVLCVWMKLRWVSADRRTRRSWRTIRSISPWAEPNFSSTKPPAEQASLFQTEETQNKLIDMSGRIFFCLLCGALAAAQELHWNIRPAAGTFGDQRPDQPQVQEPSGRPDPHHRNHNNTDYFNISWKVLNCFILLLFINTHVAGSVELRLLWVNSFSSENLHSSVVVSRSALDVCLWATSQHQTFTSRTENMWNSSSLAAVYKIQTLKSENQEHEQNRGQKKGK